MATDTVDAGEDAKRVMRSGDEPCDGPGFSAFQDVSELREPFILVDSGALTRVKTPGGELENGVRDVVEPVPDFFAHHVADDGNAHTADEGEDNPGKAAHAVPPCGRRCLGTGGRYWSLSAVSWTRAAVTAAPTMV